MVEPEVAVQEAPTVEERLEAAETQIKGLDSQLRNLEWILGMGAISDHRLCSSVRSAGDWPG
ncbi:hypothetical protein [Mycolicibacterium fortuitum]|uniref:hypothetical protein n=1 Tax=Mycolicibacterium fortuitum TaxID=1766 RepID=UPI00260F63FE|nr:hypothetical protein [Mycolicibacterium fortuitum]